jgi:SAM-dependent methyltransferase
MAIHDHEHHGHHAHGQEDSAELAELLDLDAEVLPSYLSEVILWVRGLAPDPTRRIVDLGAGTGTGAIALAEQFTGAEVTALDMSAEMLSRLTAKARALGLNDRIHTVEADLDTRWPDVGAADLVWASNSMHHMADPDRVLGEIFGALGPGGLLAVAELDSFPRFLPADAAGGVEERGHTAMAAARAEDMPHLGSDWAPRLRKAGFAIEGERRSVIDMTAPLPAAAGRYAQASLHRMRTGLDDRLSNSDKAALDRLTANDGPDSVLHRADLRIRAERTVWAARRP